MRIAMLFALLLPLIGSNTQAAKPNIVIVLADDLNADSIGCYGNPDTRTPNIDKLARQGMRFTQATTATAMCAPTRQMLYTGLYPVKSGAYPNHSQVRPGTKSIVHRLGKLGYRVGLHGKRHFGPANSFPFQKVGGGKFNADAIRKFMTEDKSEPFCLVVASHSPHVPWNQGDPSHFKPEQLTIPPYWVDTPEMRQAMTRYYAEVESLDNEVGRCMSVVEELKLDDNTIFIFTSEQGSQFPGCKWTCYETGLRVGLVIRWPGQIKAASVSEAWVNYVDILPTLVDAAGGPPVSGLDGRSFLSVLHGKTDSHNTVAYGVHTQLGAIGSQPKGYAVPYVRIGHYNYIMNLNHRATFTNALTKSDKEGYWASWARVSKANPTAAALMKRYQHRPAEELYDLDSDPHELKNLATSEKYSPVVNRLRIHLKGWMKSQGDKGQATELAAPKRKRKRKKQ